MKLREIIAGQIYQDNSPTPIINRYLEHEKDGDGLLETWLKQYDFDSEEEIAQSIKDFAYHVVNDPYMSSRERQQRDVFARVLYKRYNDMLTHGDKMAKYAKDIASRLWHGYYTRAILERKTGYLLRFNRDADAFLAAWKKIQSTYEMTDSEMNKIWFFVEQVKASGCAVPCLIAVEPVNKLYRIAVRLAPAGVHTVEHLSPVLCLGAACARVKTEYCVIMVVFAGEEHFDTLLFLFCLDFGDLVLDLFLHILVVFFYGELAESNCILKLCAELFVAFNLVFELLRLAEDFAGIFLVVPEIGLKSFLFKFLHLLAKLTYTQGTAQLFQIFAEIDKLIFGFFKCDNQMNLPRRRGRFFSVTFCR